MLMLQACSLTNNLLFMVVSLCWVSSRALSSKDAIFYHLSEKAQELKDILSAPLGYALSLHDAKFREQKTEPNWKTTQPFA